MTQLTNTGLLGKTLSNVFQNKRVSVLAEILLLLLAGVLAAVLHSKLRIPMHIPGRQGLVFMALMILSRNATSLPYASSLSFAGAAGIMAIFPLGFGSAFTPLIYLILGPACDFLYRLFRSGASHFLVIGLISGITWMGIPLLRILLTLSTGAYFDSFRFGYAYPIFTHLVFGMLGGLLGYAVFQLVSKAK